MLIRRYDRESKANKRLSMDNEELMWRMQHSDDSPDLLKRQVSHSPPGSNCSTPEPSRRRLSPMGPAGRTRTSSGSSWVDCSPKSVSGHTPRSPSSSLHSPRSPIATTMDISPRSPRDRSPRLDEESSPPPTNLKRSGTYDLLDQEFEEEDATPNGSSSQHTSV